MVNKFYSPGDLRAARVHDLFSQIAPRYDLINDLQSFGLHRLWKRRLVQMAQVRGGETALDVCCGTGDIAFALAETGACVVGLDFSEPMLRVAEARVPLEQRGTQKVAGGTRTHAAPVYIRGDAQWLPFPDNSFEIVTVGYGLRNLPDWRAGIAEMQRVCKPAGRILVLDFGKPENRLWRGVYFSYLRLFVPVLGWTFCGNAAAYSYILESLKHYPAQHGVAAGMRELGLTNVRIVNLLGGVMSINCAEKPDRVSTHSA